MPDALVIGAGPAGLMAADILSAAGVAVTLADQMPSPARKFLMAGKSGLNLTKNEPQADFARHFPAEMQPHIAGFGPAEVMAWAEGLGQVLFTGSTGRVFPKAMKASPLLRAWLSRLEQQGVVLRRRWRWTGWEGDAVSFDTPDGPQVLRPDATILALGGASWARLGSDGRWADMMGGTAPFRPANCGFVVPWSHYMTPFFGTPMKATALAAGGTTSRGEWVLTPRGIEGGGIYEVSAAVRDGVALTVDLMPDVAADLVRSRVADRHKKMSLSQFLKKVLRFPPEKVALFQEFTRDLAVSEPGVLTDAVKALPFPALTPLPMDEAISTAGGLRFDALTPGLMLRGRPGTFAAGEMLDWEAITGGYLISGCLATGRVAGQGALSYLQQQC